MIMPTGVSPWTVMRVIDEKIESCSGPWAKPVRPFGYILCSLTALLGAVVNPGRGRPGFQAGRSALGDIDPRRGPG
jgi:hypothetical protein